MHSAHFADHFFQNLRPYRNTILLYLSLNLSQYSYITLTEPTKDGKELCEKEETDRRDVAETLRMAAELQLRVDYLKNANLFADDVHKELDMEDRERSWQEYRDKHGMGLGLW